MRFVPVKTADQQAGLMLVSLRERLIRYRTQLANAIRGYVAEFGLSAARGVSKIEPLLDRIATDQTLPSLARDLLVLQGEEYARLQAQLKDVECETIGLAPRRQAQSMSGANPRASVQLARRC